MNTKHILEDLEKIKDPAALDILIKYIGNRTPEELRIILGLKRKAFSFLADKLGKEKNVETELLAFYAAAAAVRRHRPHSAKTLALIAKQREERSARHPRLGYGLKGRIEKDFDDISAYVAAGYSWTEIVDILKRRSTRYRGLPMKPDTFRKTYRRIESERASAGPVSANPDENSLASDSNSDENSLASEPVSNSNEISLASEPVSNSNENLLASEPVSNEPEPIFPERLEPLEPVGPVEPSFLPMPLG